MPVKEYGFGNGLRWIDMTDPTRDETETLTKEFSLNSQLLFDSMDPDHLPKYDVIKDVSFLIIRYYSHSIEKLLPSIQDLTSKIAIFFTAQFIITIHRSDLHFLTEIKQKQIDTAQISNTLDLVAKIMWYIIDSYDAPVQRLSEQVDFYEKQIFLKNAEPEHLESLYYIKQKAALCYKLLTLTTEPINRVMVAPEEDAWWDDVKDHHLKISTLYNLVLDDVNNLMNLYLSFSAQRTNEVIKVLTIFSVFFMPLTFVAGLYGMNFQHMPELRQKWGYPFALLLMAVLVLFIYIWFRRKKWL